MKGWSECGDDDLLVASAGGAREAFEVFYLRHRAAVLGFMLRRVGDPELAFDLAAETFAAAIVSAPRFRPGGAPALSWLFGIAANKLRESLREGRVQDEARRRLRMEPVVLDDADLEEIVRVADLDGAALRLLERLSSEQRDAITARILNERSYAEIAAELRCSPAVVRQRVHRGLRLMRQRLEARR